MYEKLNIHLTGIQSTIQHNGRLCDPTYKWTRLMKPITAKRKRTDADNQKLFELEFKGSLYLEKGEEEEKGVNPGWPGENIEAMIRDAAKSQRKGTDVTRGGILVPGFWKLAYNGPKDRDALWADEKFHFIRKVVVSGRSVMRSRVRFPEWELEFELLYLPELFDEEQIFQVLEYAGKFIGLSDWRGKHGLFRCNGKK